MNTTEYLLSCFNEECAEAIQRATKFQRFGVSEIQPGQIHTNEERLNHEVHDVLAMIELLRDNGLLPKETDRVLIDIKKRKVERFMHYSRKLGVLQK